MCGIAGYVARDPRDGDAALLGRMCDRLTHRGPDAYGSFVEGPAALGHRRLSIIDLSGGGQPLGNEDGSLQIVFNGEIYNYLELREQLVRQGHQFHTHSDTEVIVHLYEEVGERVPEHLNGMFAFVIWDRRKQELFAARDRYGKKPFYYSTSVPGFALCFASELKALLPLPGFNRENINAQAIGDYLKLGYIPDPDTIYRHVRKLPPAHSLMLSRGGTEARERRYWSPDFNIDGSMDYASTERECFELAADSVQRRMISDVPLGAFLSGGVDSSAVVALMQQRSSRAVKSFSIGFTSKEFDEVEYARMVAARYQTEHHEHTVSPSIEEMLPVVVDHYDEPYSDSSAIPTLYLSRMTRQYVTVALSGDGGDELFGGYRRYRFAVAEERTRQWMPAWMRRSVVKTMAAWYPKLDFAPRPLRAKATLESLSLEFGQAYFESMTGLRFGFYERILSSQLRRDLGGYSPCSSFVDRFRKYSHLPPLQQLEAVDLETYLPGDILVKIDRATMAYSLEGRCPLLDYRLGDLACRMPGSFKLRAGVGKYIFKQMMRPHLPADVLDRSKMGFAVPLQEWFRSTLKPVFEGLVLRPAMERYFDLGAVRDIWKGHQGGQRNHGRDLWILLMLACWDDRYGHDGSGELLNEILAATKG